MKRKFTFIYYMFIMTIVGGISGCSKDSVAIDDSDNELYEVSFKTEAFVKEEVGMGTLMATKQTNTKQANSTLSAIEDLSKFFPRLHFFLYNSSNDLVEYTAFIRFESYPDTYGQANFRLPKGSYKLVVVGSKGKTTFEDSSRYETAALIPGWQEDIFYKEERFTVDGKENLQKTVRIERIVGSLEVNETEMVEGNWGGGPVVRYQSATRYPFDKNQDYKVEEFILPMITKEFAPWTTINFISRGIVLPDRSGSFNGKVWIYIPYERQGGSVATKIFDDVILSPSVKVILKGSLTGTTGQGRFDVIADSAWRDTIVTEFDNSN